jgi:hypothetical protein
MSEYYDNSYPKKPIGGKNPYWCCASCEVSNPETNGEIDNHRENCEYRKKREAEKQALKLKGENDWLKYLLKQILISLPQNKDWLDPEIEKAAKDI